MQPKAKPTPQFSVGGLVGNAAKIFLNFAEVYFLPHIDLFFKKWYNAVVKIFFTPEYVIFR